MRHHAMLRAAGAHFDRYASTAKVEQWYASNDATLCAIGDNREALCPDYALQLHGECAEPGRFRFAVYLDQPVLSDADRMRCALRMISTMAADMATGDLSHATMREWAGRIQAGCDAVLGSSPIVSHTAKPSNASHD